VAAGGEYPAGMSIAVTQRAGRPGDSELSSVCWASCVAKAATCAAAISKSSGSAVVEAAGPSLLEEAVLGAGWKNCSVVIAGCDCFVGFARVGGLPFAVPAVGVALSLASLAAASTDVTDMASKASATSDAGGAIVLGVSGCLLLPVTLQEA
jgi:hypothetical protein